MSFGFPSIANAAWWNPFSWKVFNKTIAPPAIPPSLTEASNIPPDTSDKSAEIIKLKREIEELKKKNDQSSAKPKLSTPPVAAPKIIPKPTPVPPPFATWQELENKHFPEADQNGWATLYITNQEGEKRYYYKNKDQWIRANSEQHARSERYFIETCADKPKDMATAELCLELAGQRIGFKQGWYDGYNEGSPYSPPPSYSAPPTPSFSETMRQHEMCDLVDGLFFDGKCY